MDRNSRIKIFQETLKIVQNGGYKIDGTFISIPNKLTPEKTEFFYKPEKLTLDTDYQTKFTVINADCLETAEALLKQGFHPCVLNLASGSNPGGGVLNGAGAQEENLFRRSNLFLSLYQFAHYAKEYGLTKHEKSYPLNKNTGGIYSGDITVFRASEKNEYRLLKEPFNVAFVTVPAINRPQLVKCDGSYYIADNFVEPAKEKIRTILRISGKYRHDCLVLGAFGCGAYTNPPNHMALLFKEVFLEQEFSGKFKNVTFSIYDDHNSHREHNPEGNFKPFKDVFGV